MMTERHFSMSAKDYSINVLLNQENELTIKIAIRRKLYEAVFNQENISRKTKKSLKNVEGVFQWIKVKENYFIEEISNRVLRITHYSDKNISFRLNYTGQIEVRKKESTEKPIQQCRKAKKDSKREEKKKPPQIKTSIDCPKSPSLLEMPQKNQTQAMLPVDPAVQEDASSEKQISLSKNISLQDIFDLETPFAKHFIVQGNKVICKAAEHSYELSGMCLYQILTKRVLTMKNPERFSFRLVKTQKRRVRVGVVDRLKQREKQSSVASGNSITYNSWSGFFNWGPYQASTINHHFKYEGQGIQDGQLAEIEINLKTGSFKLIVEGKVRASVENVEILKNPKRQFVPYFELHQEGDTIEYLG